MHYSFLLALLLLVGLPSVAVEVKKPLVSLAIPDGWTEIPKTAIDRQAKELVGKVPVADYKIPDYGFQKGTDWFTYPYVVVQNNVTRRYQKSELSNLERTDLGAISKQVADKLKGAMGPVQLKQMFYDERRHEAWIYVSSRNAQGQAFITASVMIFTETGWLQITGSFEPKKFDDDLPVFMGIVNSARVNPSIAFKQ